MWPPGSETLSIRQGIFNANFPETLFTFGLPGMYAFPPDPKVMGTRAVMAFTNIQLLSLADRCDVHVCLWSCVLVNVPE